MSIGFYVLGIVLQAVAAIVALLQVPAAPRRLAWLLIALSSLVIVVRRAATLNRFYEGEQTLASFEVLTMVTSVLFIVGTLLMARMFREYRVTQASLEQRNRDLQESEARHRCLFNANTQGIVYRDHEGRIVLVNPAAERILGATAAQMLGRTNAETRWRCVRDDGSPLPGEDHPAMRSLRTGKPIDEEIIGVYRPSEEDPIWLSICVWPLFREGEERAFEVCTAFEDITYQRQVETALLENRAMLGHVLDTVPQAVFWKDREGRYLGCNRAFAAAAGLEDPSQVVGRTDFDLPWPRKEAEAYRADDREVLESNLPKAHIVEPLQRGDGSRIWIDTTKVPLRGPDSRPVGVLGVYEDITERKLGEEEREALRTQLAHSQRMESLGSLAGGVAHDLNNVLAAILSLSSAHRTHLSATDPMARALDTITSACVRGRDVVRSLLLFARRDLEEERVVDLNQMVRETVHLLSRTTLQRVTLVTDLQEPLPGIMGDGSALSHVLINLCVNAVDAMPDGGTITLQTRLGEQGEVFLRVRDTGTGMSAEVVEKAMDPFFTTKPLGKGTGLGLAIVYGTMKAHEGRVHLESRPGEGTEVTLAFPGSRAVGGVSEAAPSLALEGTPVEARILLVDDDPLILESVGDMLEMLGHKVTPRIGRARRAPGARIRTTRGPGDPGHEHAGDVRSRDPPAHPEIAPRAGRAGRLRLPG